MFCQKNVIKYFFLNFNDYQQYVQEHKECTFITMQDKQNFKLTLVTIFM